MSLPSSFVALTKPTLFLFSIFITISEAAASTPLVLYNFNEGNGSEIYDVSGNGTPLNLKISDSGSTRWLEGGGLAVDRPTLIKTTGPARKITDAIKASNALTIEAWIQPASKTQTGPARIVSISTDTHNRNLTLGQDKTAYDVRLRTTKTKDNGTPSLRSAKGTVDTNLTHVVYTRSSNGLARTYINGVLESKKRVRGKLDNWDGSYRVALANELTGDRPWTGIFYQVAIYGQALSKSEIDQSFTSGPSSSSYPAGQSTTGSTDNNSTTSNPASSGAFSETGSVLLSWNTPVARSNGEALAMSEIEGYTLYYGNTAGIYPDSVSINDAYTTSTTIAELPPGTYYFVVTARDTAGRESGYSNMTTKPVL